MLLTKTEFKIVFDIAQINEEHWNSIVSNTIFLDLAYLQAIEKTVSEVSQFIYVIYYDNENKPIGKSVFQLLEYDSSTFNFDSIPCKFQNKILRHFLNRKITILIAGNIFATGENTFYFNTNISTKTIFKQLNNAINDLIKRNKSINYTIFKEFYPDTIDKDYLIKKHDFIKFNIDVNMVLSIKENWQNFEDILKDFKTKYRSRSKNVLLKSNELTIKEFSTLDIKNNADSIKKLYNQVIKNSNFNIGIFNTNTFIKLKENLSKQYHFFGYYINDNLLGFRTSFINNNTLEASFIGIDYTQNLKYNLYQKMLIDYINFGLNNKVSKIHFGRTAETMKSCVGAQPTTMDLYIKARKKTGKFLLNLIVKNINPTEFSLRNPFKKEFYN